MHDFLIILKWALGLSVGLIGALILIAWIIATVRAVRIGRAAPWVPGDISVATQEAANEGYPLRALVALDIFLNVVVCFGQQDETMSTHAWRTSDHWVGKAMNYWLSWLQPNHGRMAASGDLERATARVAILSNALSINK